jgi:competence protein ComGF
MLKMKALQMQMNFTLSYTKPKLLRSFTLYEIIFSLVILSIVLYTSVNLIDLLNKENKKEKSIVFTQIDLESFRLFMQHKINENHYNYNNLNHKINSLYYNHNLLLTNVKSFEEESNTQYIKISLCLQEQNTICQSIILNKH